MSEHAERTAVPHGEATAMRKPGLRPRDDGPPQFPHLLREFRACARNFRTCAAGGRGGFRAPGGWGDAGTPGPPAGGKIPGRRGMPELPGPSRGAPAQSFFPPPRIFPPTPRSRTAKRPPAIRTAMTTEPDFPPTPIFSPAAPAPFRRSVPCRILTGRPYAFNVNRPIIRSFRPRPAGRPLRSVNSKARQKSCEPFSVFLQRSCWPRWPFRPDARG